MTTYSNECPQYDITLHKINLLPNVCTSMKSVKNENFALNNDVY